MSVTERLDLIEQIWDSLPQTAELDEVPAWHLEEIRKRRADAIAIPGVGRPFQAVLSELRKAQ